MSYKILNETLNKPVLGVLFDMDGVIFDTERLYVNNSMRASIEGGFPMTMEETLGLRSLSIPDRKIYLSGFLAKFDDDFLRKRMNELTDSYIERNGAPLKEGAKELIAYLKSNNIKFAITSSSTPERILRNLKSQGLENDFKFYCSGEELKRNKPYPDIYLKGAEILGLDPSDCLAIEDSPNGILAAKRAGARAIIIPDLDKPNKDTLNNCYSVADSLLDIIDLVKDLNNGLSNI